MDNVYLRQLTLVIVIIVCNVFLSANAQVAEEAKTAEVRKFKTLVYLSAGLPFSSGAPQFFDVYNGSEFSGKKNNLKLTPAVGFGTKLRFDGRYRIGAAFNYTQANLEDLYVQTVETIDESGSRTIAQNINITDMPIIITAEYMPYLSQFRTFIGGGIGLLMRKTEWKESITTSIQHDKRTGGEHYTGTDFLPAFRIYSGVELGFDRMSEETLLGSLVLEISYSYFPGGFDLFKKVKDQFVPLPSTLNKSYNILPGYIMLSAAVTLNFNKAR